MILFCAGMTLFFIPWTLAAKGQNGWTSATILVMIILGFCLIIAFVLYEAFISPKPFVSLSLLKDRNVLGTSLMVFGWGLGN